MPGNGGDGLLIDIIPAVTRMCQWYGCGGAGCWGVTSYGGGGGGAGGGPWWPRPGGGYYYNTGGNQRANTSGGWEQPEAADYPHGGYPNSGSGGGGGTQGSYGGPNVGYGGNGADGIVVVRYLTVQDYLGFVPLESARAFGTFKEYRKNEWRPTTLLRSITERRMEREGGDHLLRSDPPNVKRD